MSRFLFLSYALVIVFSCTSVESPAQAASSSDTLQNGVVLSRSKLTSDEAVAAVRSKETNPGSSLFQVIREPDSNVAMREAAQRSLREAFSHHVSLYSNGIFLDLLTTGGFLILEVDATTGNATSLHMVSSGTDGRAVIESHAISGNVSADLAQQLIKETDGFVDVLFATPLNVRMLESRFYGGRFPDSDKSEEESFFAIPPGIRKIKADPSEIRELAALFGAVHFWPIRYAISMPIYPANPTGALDLAWKEQEALLKEFMHRKDGNSDLIHDLQELESVRTSEQLRDRVATFTRLKDFLEQKLQAQEDSPTFAANRSISTIALVLGSLEPPEEISYPVMTASGIIIDWKLLNTGDLVVAQVSLAGD